ncbi:snRNA-activating protein complex subunit 3 [Taenia solium]|eukprot:TsM_000599000 transcript=TsM_000599000 gene=TsM_000599000
MTDVHEYVTIPCPTTNAKELLQQFLTELPEEFFCVTEKEADSQLKSHMISLLGSEELFEELQKDCDLGNLYLEDEFHTLDELLHVVPDRGSRHLEPLKTLEAIPKDLSEKDIEKNSLGIRRRFRRPLVDLGYLNSPDGIFDCGLPIQDVVLTVFVYRPIALAVADCSNAPWTMVMEQRIEILGSQTLSTLRDAIKCPQDMIYLGDCSEAIDNPSVHIPARAIYPSSYFFIEGVFYDDLRDPRATRLSTSVIEWQDNRKEKANETYSASTMADRVLGDLTVTLGKPYLFLHQGNCEHVIIFTTMRLTDRTCAQSVSAYPKCTGKAPQRRMSCEACNSLRAQWLVHDAGDLLPKDPTMLCITCLRYLLYTPNGEKIHPRFRVQKFFGYEFCR